MYLLVEGNVAAVKTFPYVTIRRLNYNSSYSKLYEVFLLWKTAVNICWPCSSFTIYIFLERAS